MVRGGNDFYWEFQKYFEAEKYKIAAFQLYQAVERYYHAVLPVFTGYEPKLHDIEVLGWQTKNLNPDFDKVFPKKLLKKNDYLNCFNGLILTQDTSKQYSISKEELGYLAGRVELLKELTEKIYWDILTLF